MQKATLLHNSSPEELTEKILKGVDEKLNQLKEIFQPKKPTEYLTRTEAKELLKVNLSTLYKWTKKGKLKAYGIGNRVYYKRHEIEQIIIHLQY